MNITFYSNKTKTAYYLIPIRSNYTLIRKNAASSFHIHPVYHIMFVTAGEGFLENDRSKYLLREKDIFLINPNEKHIFASSHNEGLKYITYNFYLLDASKYTQSDIIEYLKSDINSNAAPNTAETLKLDDLFDFKLTDIYFDYDRSLWDKIFSSISSLLDELEEFNVNSISSFRKEYTSERMHWFNLFSKFFWDFYIALSSHNAAGSQNKKDTDLMELIIEYLKENLQEKYSLDKLAAHLKYNPIYLCSYFKRNSGLTISQYFNKLKIIKSCEYLRSTNKSLTEIACLLNFSSPNHFSRSFKCEKNISPKDYRKHLEKY